MKRPPNSSCITKVLARAELDVLSLAAAVKFHRGLGLTCTKSSIQEIFHPRPSAYRPQLQILKLSLSLAKTTPMARRSGTFYTLSDPSHLAVPCCSLLTRCCICETGTPPHLSISTCRVLGNRFREHALIRHFRPLPVIIIYQLPLRKATSPAFIVPFTGELS